MIVKIIVDLLFFNIIEVSGFFNNLKIFFNNIKRGCIDDQ